MDALNTQVYIGVACDADLNSQGGMRKNTTFEKFIEEISRVDEEAQLDHLMSDHDCNLSEDDGCITCELEWSAQCR